MGKTYTDMKKLDAITDEDIENAIAIDTDAAPDMNKPTPGIVRSRGSQKAPTKKQVTVRLSEEVIDHFKADGPGWQTRMNAHLLKSVKKRKKIGRDDKI